MILLYCTDRERHRRRDLYRLEEITDNAGRTPGVTRLWLTRPRYGPGGSFDVSSDAPPAVPSTHTLVCPSCPRRTLLRAESFRRLYDGCASRDVSEVDISRLPF